MMENILDCLDYRSVVGKNAFALKQCSAASFRNMLANWLLFVLRYFDFFSFCTEYKPSKRYKQFVQIMFAFHIISATLTTFLIIRYINRPMSDDLGKANDIVKFGFGLIVYWTSIFEMYANRNNQQRFWRRFSDIDRFCSSHRSFLLRGYLFKFLLIQGAITFMLLRFMIKILDCGIEFLYFFYACVVITMIFINRAIYFLLFVELIKFELYTIECEAKTLASSYDSFLRHEDRTRYWFEYKRFKWIRVYYRLVYGISVDLNETFAWSNGNTILYAFQLALTDLNWFYWKWYNNGLHGLSFCNFHFIFHLRFQIHLSANEILLDDY